MDISFVYDSAHAGIALGRALTDLLKGQKRTPVILCIGSDRITGDCLGPLTGHMLTAVHNVGAYVYGTLASPVTARNLAETADFLRSKHRGSKVLVIDASLGKEEDIGLIRSGKGGIAPGSGVNKTLPKVGDFHITAVVNSVSANHVLLQTTRLAVIYRMAEVISEGIGRAVGSVCASAAIIA